MMMEHGFDEPLDAPYELHWFEFLRDKRLDEQERLVLRERAIQHHLPLVQLCVNAFNPTEQQRADLTQVGTMGLINAVDRFDPARGIPFRAFARPTIHGEILRYFRDHSHVLRLPRGIAESCREIRSGREHLWHHLGHEPTRHDLAAFLGQPVAVVEAALAAETSRRLDTIERPGIEPAKINEDLQAVPDRVLLFKTIRELPPEHREVLCLIFWFDLTQAEVARRLGRSQMHVSRVLRRALSHLRISLGAHDQTHEQGES